MEDHVVAFAMNLKKQCYRMTTTSLKGLKLVIVDVTCQYVHIVSTVLKNGTKRSLAAKTAVHIVVTGDKIKIPLLVAVFGEAIKTTKCCSVVVRIGI